MVCVCVCFLFKDTATTEIYTLSLHGALPILVLSLTILGVNLLGDALRDIWDPRLRGR